MKENLTEILNVRVNKPMREKIGKVRKYLADSMGESVTHGEVIRRMIESDHLYQNVDHLAGHRDKYTEKD